MSTILMCMGPNQSTPLKNEPMCSGNVKSLFKKGYEALSSCKVHIIPDGTIAIFTKVDKQTELNNSTYPCSGPPPSLLASLPFLFVERLGAPKKSDNAMSAGEGSIKFNWRRQVYIGKFKDQEKVFLISKWHDKEFGAIKAARKWLLGLRG